jgi:predicted RNase H-like HicB family nuclease
MKLESIVWKEGKYFVAQCLNVDVSSFGETKQQALNNLKEAVLLYMEDAHPEELVPIDEVEVIHDLMQDA